VSDELEVNEDEAETADLDCLSGAEAEAETAAPVRVAPERIIDGARREAKRRMVESEESHKTMKEWDGLTE